MARKSIIDWRRRRLMRREIPLRENVTVVGVAIALVGVVWWTLAQRDAYDPTERDLPIELLMVERPPIEIYNVPLKRWSEPGTSPTATATPALGLFPPSLIDENWQLKTRVRTFDASNLYEKINGEAEKFIKQGLRNMHYATLQARDGTEFAIELYDQGGVGGSLGIFSGHRPASRDVEERAGVSYFPTSVGVIGRVGPYFFRAAADRTSEAVARKSIELVEALATLVAPAANASVPPAIAAPVAGPTAQPAVAPQPMQILAEALDLSESDLAFEAANVFQFDFAQAFWFGTMPDGGRAFLHEAADVDAAQGLFDLLAEELGYDYEVLERKPRRVIMRHEFLGTYMTLARYGIYVAGAENLPAITRVNPVLGKLEARLGGGAAK